MFRSVVFSCLVGISFTSSANAKLVKEIRKEWFQGYQTEKYVGMERKR